MRHAEGNNTRKDQKNETCMRNSSLKKYQQ